MTATVIFDFDGTLALGDGPLHAYAASVAEAAGEPALIPAAAAALATFAAGGTPWRDGYHAIRAAAESLGVSPGALEEGYLRSRTLLATPAAPVHAPEGLAGFLARLADRAELVLVTNSPPVRIDEALGELGAAPYIGRRVCSARKPYGLVDVVRAALREGPVLSVGDIEEYDLAPAAKWGADTAAVGAAAASAGARATMAAPTLAELYPAIEAWAARAAEVAPER